MRAREKLLWYPWYPRDYAADEHVQVMSLAAEACYRRLLDHQWLHGSIPAEQRKLAAICKGFPVEQFPALWEEVSPCFHPVDGERLQNGKLERIRAEQAAKSKRRQRAGKLGGKATATAKHNASSKVTEAQQPPSIASSVLVAKSRHTEVEVEEEAEEQTTPPPCVGARVIGLDDPDALHLVGLMPPGYQDGVAHFLAWAVQRVPQPRQAHKLTELCRTVDGALRGLGTEGMRPASLEAIGLACSDFPGIEPPMEPSPANLRACINRVERDLAKGLRRRAEEGVVEEGEAARALRELKQRQAATA